MDSTVVQERALGKRACCCSVKCAAFCAFLVALASLALGLLAPMLVTEMINSGIASGDVINSANADGYQHFVNCSYESDNRFIVTFFNITNAQQVLAASNVKPNLQEIGPFVYNYYRNRTDVGFGLDGETVSYNQHAWIEFNPNETMAQTKGKYKSDQDIQITTINVLFLGVRVQAGRSYWHAVSDLLLWKDDYSRLFEHRSPRELLLGYNVEIKLGSLPTINISFPGLFPNVALSADPDMKHKTSIQTGQSNAKATFEYLTWRDQTEVKVDCPYGKLHLPGDGQCKVNPYPCCGQSKPVYVWDPQRVPGEFDENANAVHGTSGDQFRPGLHAELEQVVVFFDLAQRAISMVTTPGEGSFDYQGVRLRKFRPDRTLVWGNSKERSANARYYQWGPAGLMNLTVLFGADVFISLPHFLDCDEELADAFTGLKPNKELHDLYIGVEPYTGITMVEQQRAMLSVKVQAETGVPGLDAGWFPTLGNRTLFVPVAWFNQQALATTSGTDQVQQIYMAMTAIDVLRWVAVGFGALGVICIVLLAVQVRKSNIRLGMVLVRASQTSMPTEIDARLVTTSQLAGNATA